MKKLFVCAAVFAAAVIAVSCGGSDDSDLYCGSFSYECQGHQAKVCADDLRTWYEVEGTDQKFYCTQVNCTDAAADFVSYCGETVSTYYDNTTGGTCIAGEQKDCNGQSVDLCVEEDDIWYKVGDRLFECDDENCSKALKNVNKYCAG